MQISKIEQNSNPIIPQMSLSEMGMYDRIKEEIKGEIEICVPAKVLSIYGYYATVQPLPNIKTNAEKFVERKPVTVKFIGNVSVGDIGYLISGDVSHTNKKGTLIHDSTYDPAESELHKFSNGFFISSGSSGYSKYEQAPIIYSEYFKDWQVGNYYLITEDRYYYSSAFDPNYIVNGTLIRTLNNGFELFNHMTNPCYFSNLIPNTSEHLNSDADLLTKFATSEYDASFPYSNYMTICACFSYSWSSNRLYKYMTCGLGYIVVLPYIYDIIFNPYDQDYDLKKNVLSENKTIATLPPYTVLIPLYLIDMKSFLKEEGAPRILNDLRPMCPRSLPYFGRTNWPED